MTYMGKETGLFGCLRSAAIATASIPPSEVVLRTAISHTRSLPSSSVQSIFSRPIHYEARTKPFSMAEKEERREVPGRQHTLPSFIGSDLRILA